MYSLSLPFEAALYCIHDKLSNIDINGDNLSKGKPISFTPFSLSSFSHARTHAPTHPPTKALR